jgi:hypothetical protein
MQKRQKPGLSPATVQDTIHWLPIHMDSENVSEVKVTLQLAVYLQSVLLGAKPFETHD